ncbi:MAG: NrdR family transcriptional regulator [Candidatus Saccharibacteria bacterium]|nr:NrdR family transcriptional regulator [Candidatus Saccharibacteria bacterium]
MVCIYCSGNTQVINSRLQKRANSVWRRRKCLNCQAVFTTSEVAQYDGSWRVQSGKQLIAFSRDKLLLSIYESVRHRPEALQDASALTETIIGKLRHTASDGLLTIKDIIVVAQAILNNFDDAAYVHYRAFHQ